MSGPAQAPEPEDPFVGNTAAVTPELLWKASTWCHERGHGRTARLLKAVNFFVFRAILPPEARVGSALALGHFGQGVVVHPNVVIGDDVRIWHNVTLAVADDPGSATSLTIGDHVSIGAGTIIITRDRQSLVVGEGAVIGAGSVVTSDVPANVLVVGNPARIVRALREREWAEYRQRP